ncbi:BGTF surface domain-containing protein [Halorubellus sp. PRR65]|uniref:BGTF surface domain-containing protein n=1 Tax=Halorubellus sp. PRR65 TaxID=3098148 RepID=UPI002B25F470|nr:BGTF surface domain-containing protein [Halorubellus sp. PRR65]
MTDETNKLRALVLTALMVTSVFAGTVALAGTAAAANSATITLSDQAPNEPGVEYNTSADVSLSNQNTLVYVDVDLGSADVSNVDASDISVYVDGNEYTDGLTEVSASSGVVEFKLSNSQSLSNGDTVRVAVDNVKNPSSVSTPSYSVSLSDSSDTQFDSWSGTYTITGSQVGVTQAQPSSSPVFQGQDLVLTNVNPGTTVEVRENTSSGSSYENNYEVGSDGSVTVPTSDFNGDYFVKAEDTSGSSVRVNFEVVPQTLSVGFASSTVANSGEDSEVDLEIDSNRASNFGAYVLSENMTDQELRDVFSSAGPTATDVDIDQDGDAGDDDGIMVTGLTRNDNNEATLNFTDVEAGPKNLTFSVTDTTASDTAAVNVNAPAEGSAGFVTQAISDERGDIVVMNVSITGATDRATVNVGGTSVRYQESVTLVDDNDDGYVEFYWNTATAGTSDNTTFQLPSGSDDAIAGRTLSSQFANSNQRLGAAEYPVNATVGGDETGVATVVVRNPNNVDRAINVWTAPDGKNSLSPKSDDYYQDYITQDSTAAIEDEVVLEIKAAGVYGTLVPSAKNDAVITGPFTQVNGAQLNITQTVASTPPNTPATTINTKNKTTLLSPTENTMYMFVDTDKDNFSVSDKNPRQTFNVNMTFDSAWAYGKKQMSTVQQFSVIQRTGNIDGAEPNSEDPLIVAQSDEAEITGSSSAATGTNLTISARSSSGQNPFLRTATATVQSDGTWSTTLNLGDIPTGTNFTVAVKDGSQSLESVDAQIGGAANLQLASLDAPESAAPGSTITVTATVENTGDSSGETEVAYMFNGTTESTQNVSVDAGSTTEVTFEYTVPSSTGDYTHGVMVGDNDAVTAGITVQDETSTTTTPTTTTPTTTPTTTEPTDEPTTSEAPTTSEPTDEETTTSDEGGSPGFGVAVALVALVAAALLATRRDE